MQTTMPIIGREYALVQALTKALRKAAGGRHVTTVIKNERTPRGFEFEVAICEPDQKPHERIPTGRIARVTVELDRVEDVAKLQRELEKAGH